MHSNFCTASPGGQCLEGPMKGRAVVVLRVHSDYMHTCTCWRNIIKNKFKVRRERKQFTLQ